MSSVKSGNNVSVNRKKIELVQKLSRQAGISVQAANRAINDANGDFAKALASLPEHSSPEVTAMPRKSGRVMKTIRTTLTFTFDETKVSEQAIKDRLDAALAEEFATDVDDLHTRWVAKLSDSPLFGSAVHPKMRRLRKGGA